MGASYKLKFKVKGTLRKARRESKTSFKDLDIEYTANIYSQITVGFATQPKSVLSTVKLQSLAVQITVIDFEEYSYSLSDVFGCNMCSKITVGFATQLKAVPSTVKIFAVCLSAFKIHL